MDMIRHWFGKTCLYFVFGIFCVLVDNSKIKFNIKSYKAVSPYVNDEMAYLIFATIIF